MSLREMSSRRLSHVIGLLVALVIASGAGIAFSGSTVIAQEPACWNETPGGAMGFPQWTAPPQMVIDPARTYTATIQTNRGDIVVDLLADQAPNTVNNFVCLARAGYYDLVLFHRIITGFMIQSGDPTATGSGGPGYQFADELPGEDLNYDVGTVAMANAGANTNGSQFFIVHGDQGAQLPKNYTIFGRVSAGQDVVDAIAAIPVGPTALGEVSVPQTHVGFMTITIQEL